MVQGGLARLVVVCLCAAGLLSAAAAPASASLYFGATISGESYGHPNGSHAPEDLAAWNLFERHAGRKVAILHQGQAWLTFDKAGMDATSARGAIPSVTMGLGDGVTLAEIVAGEHDAAIEKWAQQAKAWGRPFLFAPWWEMNGNWYPWGRNPDFIAAWRRFHDLVEGEGATNVTWLWVVNSIWSDPLSDPTPYYPGDAYVDWTGLDSYNWGRNPAQPDKWTSPEQTLTPTLTAIRKVAPSKPVAIVENAASEYGGNKADWIREMLTNYLPHHPEIKAYYWFNWNFQKGDKRSDWPIETSAPAQQRFRKAIQGSTFVSGPVSLPTLTKVPPPAPAPEPAQPGDVSPAAEMAAGPDLAIAPDGTATVVWSAREGSGFAVFARRLGFDGSAGTTHRLSVPGEDAFAPQVALAPDGTATVVWTRAEGADFRIQARRIGADGTPEEATRTLSGSGQDALDPQVDVAPDGEATVVWKRFDGFHYLVQVRRIAPDGTSEAAAQRLSEPKQDAVEPMVAVADDGVATVVWSRFDGADSIVQTRRVEADGTLEATIENLSAAGESAIESRVAVGPEGEATVVWNRFNGANWIVQARRLSPAGEAEAGAVDLSASGQSAAEPQLALDPEGRATAVWNRFDGSNFVVQARRLDSGGAPEGEAVNLSTAGADAADPRLAVNDDGTASALWSRFDGSRWVLQRRDLDAAGGLTGVVNLSSIGWSAGDAVLAWGEEGTLTMAWRRFDDGGDAVQAKTAPGPRPPLPPPPPPTVGGSPSGPSSPPIATGIDNAFRIAGIRLDRKRGTAKLTVVVSGPGQLALWGASPRRRQVEGGKVTLLVIPKAGQRRALREQGTLRLKVTVTFDPAAGDASSRDLSLRLKKTRR